MPSDYTNRAITSDLKPILSADGFYRRHPRCFVRIRGDLVDVVSFQVSQYGSKLFYVHHFCNLLPDPNWEYVITGYQVGNRLGRRDGDGSEWIGDTEDNAKEAIKSVVHTYEATIKPWFEMVPDVRNWIVEYIGSGRSTVNSFEMVVALALIGKKSRSWWILCDLIDSASDSKQKSFLTDVQNAIGEDRFEALFNDWRQRAISKNMLEKAVI